MLQKVYISMEGAVLNALRSSSLEKVIGTESLYLDFPLLVIFAVVAVFASAGTNYKKDGQLKRKDRM